MEIRSGDIYMSDNEKNDKPLPIPANCSPEEYIIEGFTALEISYVAIAGLIAFIIGGIIFFRQENALMAVFIIVLLISVAIVFFRKDRYTENMPDKFRILSRNSRMPKKYDYTYVNIYELLTDADKDKLKEAENGTEKK